MKYFLTAIDQMKIALFSDIHANLPALQSFFEDVSKHNPDAIYCLGDLVGYNIWPNEVIQEIRQRGIATIAGNHDAKVKGVQPAEPSKGGKGYAYDIIDNDNRVYLQTLPAHLRISFQLNNDILTILLVHGSPRSIDEYLLEDMEEAALLNTFLEARTDILCFGHSHKPYHRIVLANGEEHPRFLHAINTGSIGKPKDGNPQGGYVLLHIKDNSSTLDKDSIQVEFIRFDYDIEKAAQAVENSPLPDDFADMLRKAY
ncbi:metallophosphoesterase family protein [Chitinophaga defluvii]|uniref:Metallophosphoesterase family protein n=1 Tax=Chitinophaga defluvii TaxID=3163343 RepID=A0ABV2T470_9BACT